ncbi:MAG: hypothetical protein ACRETD_02960 [Steroidobacteraceae bacterium]
MAFVQGRPVPPGGSTFRAGLVSIDRRPHPAQNIAPRTVRPINYSPLGPSTLHTASPLKKGK